jgi:hypothetical protein
MANGNGNDRLDRIEAAVESIAGAVTEVTGAVAAITGILRQVVEQQQRFQLGMNELRDKLDGLIGVVESEHRNFNERLKRLES